MRAVTIQWANTTTDRLPAGPAGDRRRAVAIGQLARFAFFGFGCSDRRCVAGCRAFVFADRPAPLASTLRRSASMRLITSAGSRRSGRSMGLPSCFFFSRSFRASSYRSSNLLGSKCAALVPTICEARSSISFGRCFHSTDRADARAINSRERCRRLRFHIGAQRPMRLAGFMIGSCSGTEGRDSRLQACATT
jgi:hypothetical protein